MFRVIDSCIRDKLESESGNEHVAHARKFYSAQKMRRLNQISRPYSIDSSQISRSNLSVRSKKNDKVILRLKTFT